METSRIRTSSIAIALRPIAILAVFCTGLALGASGQYARSAGQFPPAAYELYSWQEPNGNWSFCVLRSPSGVNISAEQVFDKKNRLSGVTQLKGKLSELPIGATVFWLDGIVGTIQVAKGGTTLRYPPPEMTQKIRRYAATRSLKVEMLSDESGQH